MVTARLFSAEGLFAYRLSDMLCWLGWAHGCWSAFLALFVAHWSNMVQQDVKPKLVCFFIGIDNSSSRNNKRNDIAILYAVVFSSQRGRAVVVAIQHGPAL